MNKANIMKNTLISSLMIGALSFVAGTASAATVDLCAGETTMDLPDGTSVSMWGYAPGHTDDTVSACVNDPTFPGPQIDVPDTDTTLTINLTNTLSDPTSIVIPGLPMPTPLGPTWDDNSTGPRAGNMTKKVRSFGAETGAGSTGSYTWNGLRPGTFIYHSGTHPQVQVYMGLYGAMTQNFADAGAGPAEAYDGVEYFNEVVMFYSELDTDLNEAVDLGSHTTSIDYHANWFLINGEPYTSTTSDIASGSNGSLLADQKTLVRFLSTAGETHVPVIQGMHMSIHAEDGFEYNWQDGATEMANAPRQQYSVMMPPLKTKDVIISAPADGRYAIYDGNGYMTNPTDPAAPEVTDPVGGMLRFLAFGSAVNQAPIADPNGPYSGAVGSPVAFDGTGSTDDGTIDSYAWDFGDTNTGIGATPSHTYTSDNGGVPYDVTLTVIDDAGLPSAPVATTATIAVNQPPMSDPNGPYNGFTGVPVAFDGTGSSDPDGSVASYAWDFGDTNTGIGATPSHMYTSDNGGVPYDVTLTVTDDLGSPSAPVMTTATIADNLLPTAEANGPYGDSTGESILFSSAGSGDADGFIVSYEWDFDASDGITVDATGPSPSNSYATDGVYTVTLTVTDNLGASSSDIATATIVTANEAPIADAGGPYTVSLPLEGGIVDFDGSASSDPDGDILNATFDWDFGDGNVALNAGPTPSHTYTVSTTYVATLTLTDEDGGVATDTAVVYIVDSLPPIANNDSVSVPRTSDTLIDVLANDNDGDAAIDPLSIVITSQPSVGAAVVVGGQIEYRPPNGNSRIREALQVRYTVNDVLGKTSNVAIVTIRVIR